MTDNSEFFYPNRMGKIILRALEEIGGKDTYRKILEAAALPQFTDHSPSGDLEREFPFDYVSRIEAGAETVLGAQAGRELNRKVGRACLAGGLQEFNPLIGIADLPVRMLPPRP